MLLVTTSCQHTNSTRAKSFRNDHGQNLKKKRKKTFPHQHISYLIPTGWVAYTRILLYRKILAGWLTPVYYLNSTVCTNKEGKGDE